jgi:hypothetical protein
MNQTGSGGGGGANSMGAISTGGRGGDGVVILRYLTADLGRKIKAKVQDKMKDIKDDS